MRRLTSNKNVSEMSMLELAHNSCYVKHDEAWYRDYSSDVDARTMARKLLVDFADGDDAFTCEEDFDEYITACLEDGMDSIEGLIALFYRNTWAMADLWAHLKYYEDLQEQGMLEQCIASEKQSEESAMNEWAHIENCTVLICFFVIAIVFWHWWIMLFSILFLAFPRKRSGKKSRKGLEPKRKLQQLKAPRPVSRQRKAEK